MEVKERLLEFIRHLEIGVATFERSCGLSNNYVRNIRNGISPKKLSDILRAYPQLNKNWLLFGEGEMCLDPPNTITQQARGGNTTQIAGNGNNVNEKTTVEKFLNEISAQRGLTQEAQKQAAKSQEQIDRLISLLEKMKG